MGPDAQPTPRVFVSSTRGDMDHRVDATQTIRILVRAAIKSAGGQPVCQEESSTDRDRAWAYCVDMLRESTHYLGVFGFRLGSCPPELGGRSYTQAEYDWARDPNQHKGSMREVAVFIPDEANGDAWAILHEQAGKTQTADVTATQTSYIRDLLNRRLANRFTTFIHLHTLVHHRVNQWKNGPLRSVHRVADPVTVDHLPHLRRLGRAKHREAFRKSLQQINLGASPRVGCFLVHGPAGYGHDHLIDSCRAEFQEPVGDVRPITLAVTRPWTKPTPAGLLREMAEELGCTPSNPLSTVARTLGGVLGYTDVVLEIHNPNDLVGGLVAFADEFWRPLVRALGAHTPRHRLIAFMHIEETLTAPTKRSQRFDPARPVQLPVLGRFTRQELVDWLAPWLLDATVAAADGAMRQTRGEPDRVFAWAIRQQPWDTRRGHADAH